MDGISALFFLYVTVLQQLLSMVATYHVPSIEQYDITRTGKVDLFSVVYSNSECPVNSEVCKSLSANVFNSTTPCKCACKPDHPTFLPELRMCSNKMTVKHTLFETAGCSSLFDSWPFFLKTLNLDSKGNQTFSSSKAYRSCQVVPQTTAYYNYQALHKWVDIHDDIFNVKVEENKVVFKWRAIQIKELLGRIIRVKINCSYSTSESKTYKTGCLVFKAKGKITYNLHSFYNGNHSTLQPSPSTSVTLPQQSSQTTSILPHPSSSSLSPQTRQTKLVSMTTGLRPVTSRAENIVPSVTSLNIQPSSATTAVPSTSSTVGNGPGNNKAISTGNRNPAVIGAVVAAAVVLGIFVIIIIVLYKRRKTNINEMTSKQEDLDMQMGRTRGKHVTTTNGQTSQPTYQGLVFDRGQINGAALHSPLEEYGQSNSTFYQSLSPKTLEITQSVYQNLKNGQLNTGNPSPKPKPRTKGHLNNRAKVMSEPVNVDGVKQPDVEQGDMPEPLYNVLEGPDPESDSQSYPEDTQDPLYLELVESGPENDCGALEGNNHGDTQDPLYNVLEGPEPVYEFQNVGNTSIEQDEPVYVNVQNWAETKEDPKEPISCVQESSDAQDTSQETQVPNESLYKALEGSISDGLKKIGADSVQSNLPFYLAAYDNPGYDPSLESDVAFGVVVRRSKPKKESVYEPLRASNGNDLYQSLKKPAV